MLNMVFWVWMDQNIEYGFLSVDGSDCWIWMFLVWNSCNVFFPWCVWLEFLIWLLWVWVTHNVKYGFLSVDGSECWIGFSEFGLLRMLNMVFWVWMAHNVELVCFFSLDSSECWVYCCEFEWSTILKLVFLNAYVSQSLIWFTCVWNACPVNFLDSSKCWIHFPQGTQESRPAFTVPLSLNLPWVPWDLRPAKTSSASRESLGFLT